MKTSNNVLIGKFILAQIVQFKIQDKIYHYSECEVIENYKGEITKTIKLLNDLFGCGQIYEKGKEYLLFSVLYKSTKSPHLHRCYSYCPEINEEGTKMDLIEIRNFLNDHKRSNTSRAGK